MAIVCKLTVIKGDANKLEEVWSLETTGYHVKCVKRLRDVTGLSLSVCNTFLKDFRAVERGEIIVSGGRTEEGNIVYMSLEHAGDAYHRM